MESARQVFDETSGSSVLLWNVLINGRMVWSCLRGWG